MTEMELVLPVQWNTICKHLLHHVFSPNGTIARCGPFCCNSMLPGERNHTQLKSCCRGNKNHQLSICRFYAKRQSQVLLAGTEDDLVGDDVCASDLQSMRLTENDLQTPPYLWVDYVAHIAGAVVERIELDSAVFGQVLDLFAIENSAFRRLLHMYRKDCARGRYAGDIMDWHPLPPTRALSEHERELLRVDPVVKLYRRATLNGLTFTSTEYERKNARTFRSGVKQWYREQETGQEKWAYGVIDRIFEFHFPTTDHPDVIIDCTWMKTLYVDDVTGLTVVENSRAHPWNDGCSVTFLRMCRPAHILYWPVDLLSDGNDGRYYVIDRGNEYYQY